MDTQTIILLAIMVLILFGVGFVVFSFVRSIIERRAYEREELPDIYEVEIEDEVLPDVEESGFSSLDSEFGTEEESASEMYREIQDEGLDRRSR